MVYIMNYTLIRLDLMYYIIDYVMIQFNCIK
jgi:hypothetical protein